MLRHLTHHIDERNYVVGSMQLRVVMALYDRDVLRNSTAPTYLERSASIMRSTVTPRPDQIGAKIDRSIVLVQDTKGPYFANRQTVMDTGIVRHVGNFHYTKDFATAIFREMLYSMPSAVLVRDRMLKILAENDVQTYDLMPCHRTTWDNLFEDLWRSNSRMRLIADVGEKLRNDHEYEHLSIDGTIHGGARRRRSATKKK